MAGRQRHMGVKSLYDNETASALQATELRRPALNTSLPAGTRLGRYQIRSALGAGGMGEIYLAEDKRLGRLVALKILPAAFLESHERLYRFEQEARAASALNHPNIITIHEIDEDNGTHFIATEFVEGVTLRRLMQRGEINLSEMLAIALQLTSALVTAHAYGIIHRDIKPENVMVRSDGLVKVLDFGLVKLTEAYGANTSDPTLIKSELGIVRGTIAYMSPEQARGLPVDERTDVWSLGCLLYEMLARRTAFVGTSTTDMLISIIQEEPQPLQTYVQGVPAELAGIIARMMRKSREERYQSINEVRADLRLFSQSLNLGEGLAGADVFAESRGRARTDRNETSYAAGAGATLNEAASALSQERHPNNLSEELTPFVGRREEMAAIEEMLRRDDVRLVTLTGCCGTGKTRLAQMVARRSLLQFADGVFFIDLAPLTDAELVASAIAQTLGVQESGIEPLGERLKEFLKDKRMLFVLDNFEKLMGAAPLMKELLSSAHALKMLVTSRVPLHLNAEHEFSVPPLRLPPTAQMTSTGRLMQYEAIALFVGRAQAVKPTFRLTERNASSVAEICVRLDGLPLAIELAATRVKLLSPQSILKRLQNRLRLLTGGARDLPARQRTMRAAISWSYDLLEEKEKKHLDRLSVFAGGCTLDAAERVCASDCGLQQLEMLDRVAVLVDKSLLVQQEQADGEPRFRMLEVVRAYTLEALEGRGESEAMRRLHAGYYLTMAEEAEQALLGERSTWLDKLEVEHDNLRAALQWSNECDAETALRLTGSLQMFWLIRGHLAEGRKWSLAVLERSTNAPPAAARWKTLFGVGHLAQRQGDYPEARNFYDQSLTVAIEIGDRRQIALSNWGLGALACLQSDLSASRAFLEKSLTISRELDDREIIGMSLNVLGEVERTQGNYRRARPLYEEALAFRRQISDKAGLCATLINLGAVAYFESDYEGARLYYREVLVVGQELRHKSAISHALDGVAALATRHGDAESAAQLAGAAARLHESIGYRDSKTVDHLFRDAYLSTLRATTSDEAFAVAYERGRTLQLDEAIALALRESTGD
jgi:predicted ATPase